MLLDALECRNVHRPPIWLMRQAGRYLPQYRSLRRKHSLLELFHSPELIVEVTKQPVEYLEVDAAILFSDILIVLEAFGIPYDFHDGVGPVIARKIDSAIEVNTLKSKNVRESLAFVEKAIRWLIPELKVPLIGFSGAPFTIASYLIEGGASREFKKTKAWLYSDPAQVHVLLEKIYEVILDYLLMQIEAGVQAIQLFDSWAGILSDGYFHEFSLAYLKRIVEAIRPSGIPVILFCRCSSLWARELAKINPACISIDWNGNLPSIRREIGSKVALQGNLDPSIFYGTSAAIRKEAVKLLDSMKGDKGFIVNLGHGMLPDAPFEKVKELVSLVKSHE